MMASGMPRIDYNKSPSPPTSNYYYVSSALANDLVTLPSWSSNNKAKWDEQNLAQYLRQHSMWHKVSIQYLLATIIINNNIVSNYIMHMNIFCKL